MTLANSKDTIYVDADDEITALIDKLQTSTHKIIALVLPKRASVLHSIINMKLLKRAAANSKKSLVLITSEEGLMPLAGVVGVHVAKTLQSKPYIPKAPETAGKNQVSETAADEIAAAENGGALGAASVVTPDLAATVGELDNNISASKIDENETINLEDLENDELEKQKAEKPQKVKEPKKELFGGKIKVPNFERFRTRLLLGGVILFVLIIGWFLTAIVWPHATINISTNSSSITSTIPFTANAAIKTVDLNQKILPAFYEENKQTVSEKVPATGQKDIGTKATGKMTIYNCPKDKSNSVVIPAGTIFTNSGFSFSTDQAVTVPSSNFFPDGSCKVDGIAEMTVTATQSGINSNLSAGRNYTSNFGSTITGNGSAMAGGTSKILTVVSQADVDNAKAKMKGRLDETAKTALKVALNKDGVMPILESLTISEPAVTAAPAIDTESAETTVTAVTTYGQMGVKKSYLSQLVKQDVDKQIDKNKQSILDDGIATAIFKIDSRKDNNTASITLQTIANAGPRLDPKAIANDIRGKKKGAAEQIIMNRPGITDVKISYSPFWVMSTPRAAKKITVNFQKPVVKSNSSKPVNASNP